MLTVSAFKSVPPFARGLVRDLRVRWALEEAGLAYRTRLLGQGDQASADYRALQPFGQVPTLEEDGFALFESGAILLHIAERAGNRDWLEDRFTVGDLMMTTVLRILRHTPLVAAEPTLAAYQARCEARPAFQRALKAQMADFEQR